jgi:hypothetical protein
MTKYIFISIICLSAYYSYGQTWPKIYGDGFDSNIRDLIETYDNGHLMVGNISTNRYIWLIKIDANGEIIWEKKIGKPSDYRSYGHDLHTTDEHGFILAGGSKKYDPEGFSDPAFYKFDSCGNMEWCRVLMSPDYNLSTGIIQNGDGTFTGMMAYYGGDVTTVRISLVKLDGFGEPLWIKHLCQEDPEIYNEEGWHLLSTSDTSYLITGRCYYPGAQPFWILTDTAGDQIWDLMAGNPTGQAHKSIEFDPGIFYSSSSCEGPGRPGTPVIFKLDNDGSLLGKYYLLGDTITIGSADGIAKYNDSSLIVATTWNNGTTYSDVVITDTIGNVLNRRVLHHEFHPPKVVLKTINNKILAAGDYVQDNNWDIYLWKLNADLEDDTLNNQPITYDSLCPYPIVSDTIDYDCDLFVNIEELPTQEEYEQTLKIFPNPASEYLVIDLKQKETNRNCVIQIFNAIGTKQEERRVTPGSLHVTINVLNYPPD